MKYLDEFRDGESAQKSSSPSFSPEAPSQTSPTMAPSTTSPRAAQRLSISAPASSSKKVSPSRILPPSPTARESLPVQPVSKSSPVTPRLSTKATATTATSIPPAPESSTMTFFESCRRTSIATALPSSGQCQRNISGCSPPDGNRRHAHHPFADRRANPANLLTHCGDKSLQACTNPR